MYIYIYIWESTYVHATRRETLPSYADSLKAYPLRPIWIERCIHMSRIPRGTRKIVSFLHQRRSLFSVFPSISSSPSFFFFRVVLSSRSQFHIFTFRNLLDREKESSRLIPFKPSYDPSFCSSTFVSTDKSISKSIYIYKDEGRRSSIARKYKKVGSFIWNSTASLETLPANDKNLAGVRSSRSRKLCEFLFRDSSESLFPWHVLE